MIVIIMFLGLIVGLNCIPLLTKTYFPAIEKVIVKILIISTILFLTFSFFDFNGYKLKGLYSFPTIGLTFIISTFIFFALFKNTKKKILTVLLITPLIGLSIITLLIGRVVKEFKINDTYYITVSTSGFLACGENIKITKSEFVLFNKEVFYIDNLCLFGIYHIETIKFDDKHAKFLIYHNGKSDSENPYKYDVERKNVW